MNGIQDRGSQPHFPPTDTKCIPLCPLSYNMPFGRTSFLISSSESQPDSLALLPPLRLFGSPFAYNYNHHSMS